MHLHLVHKKIFVEHQHCLTGCLLHTYHQFTISFLSEIVLISYIRVKYSISDGITLSYFTDDDMTCSDIIIMCDDVALNVTQEC